MFAISREIKFQTLYCPLDFRGDWWLVHKFTCHIFTFQHDNLKTKGNFRGFAFYKKQKKQLKYGWKTVIHVSHFSTQELILITGEQIWWYNKFYLPSG